MFIFILNRPDLLPLIPWTLPELAEPGVLTAHVAQNLAAENAKGNAYNEVIRASGVGVPKKELKAAEARLGDLMKSNPPWRTLAPITELTGLHL